MSTTPMSLAQFGQTIKAKYPDYANVPDEELGQRMLAKFPEYQQHVSMKSTVAPPTQPPGFFQRLGEASGLPTSGAQVSNLAGTAWGEAKKMMGIIPPPPPGQTVGQAMTDPNYIVHSIPIVGTIVDMAKDYGQNVGKQFGKSRVETREALTDIMKGQPIMANLGKIGATTLDTAGALTAPVGGESLLNYGKDIQQGNYRGALGGAVGLLGSAALMKGGKTPAAALPAEETRVAKIARAIGASGSSTDFSEVIPRALPDLDKAVAAVGVPPRNLTQLGDVIKTADRSLNTEYGLKLQPIRGMQVVPTQIADGLRDAAKAFDPTDPVEASVQRRLLQRANTFDLAKTYGSLDQARINANNRLTAFEEASLKGQTKLLRTSADVIADKIIADGARDIVYDAMDAFHNQNLPPGVPPYDFRALKARQGALFQLANQTKQEAIGLRNQTLVQKGSTIAERGHVSTYGRPDTLHLGVSMHNLLGLLSSPEGRAGSAVRAAFVPSVSARGAIQGAVVPAIGATYPVRSAAAKNYTNATDVMLDMKNGTLSQQEGNRLLQQMKGKGSIVRPLAPPQ